MRDQRLTLRNYGIASAEFINSDVDKLTQRRILEEAKLGYVRLLYISPERLRIKKFLAELEELQKAVPINFLAVDEARRVGVDSQCEGAVRTARSGRDCAATLRRDRIEPDAAPTGDRGAPPAPGAFTEGD